MVSPEMNAIDQGRQLRGKRHEKQFAPRFRCVRRFQPRFRKSRLLMSTSGRYDTKWCRHELPRMRTLAELKQHRQEVVEVNGKQLISRHEPIREESDMRNVEPHFVESSMASRAEGMEEVPPVPAEGGSVFQRARRMWAKTSEGVMRPLGAWWSATELGARYNSFQLSSPACTPRWKRMLDVTCLLVTSPCWLAAMLLVALWIKIVSPGPTFYRQERIGIHGRRFIILKFRSMRVNVETRCHEDHLTHLIKANCPMKKLDSAGDPRLIPGGRVLRALGLDELPQILNILCGEMSLVGPRPCTPHEFQQYKPWQHERVNALPGLTGFWQVRGKNKTTFSEMIEMDLYYVRNSSLQLDLQIILRTVPSVLSQLVDSWTSQSPRRGSLNRRIAMEQPAVE